MDRVEEQSFATARFGHYVRIRRASEIARPATTADSRYRDGLRGTGFQKYFAGL